MSPFSIRHRARLKTSLGTSPFSDSYQWVRYGSKPCVRVLDQGQSRAPYIDDSGKPVSDVASKTVDDLTPLMSDDLTPLISAQ